MIKATECIEARRHIVLQTKEALELLIELQGQKNVSLPSLSRSRLLSVLLSIALFVQSRCGVD
jgi:hypothetical protein